MWLELLVGVSSESRGEEGDEGRVGRDVKRDDVRRDGVRGS